MAVGEGEYPIPAELLHLFMDDGAFRPDMWWWGFDHFFVGFVQAAAKKMREDGHGHPGDMSWSGWCEYLKGIEDDLEGYRDWDNWDEEAEGYERAKAAMRRFVDRMGTWWD